MSYNLLPFSICTRFSYLNLCLSRRLAPELYYSRIEGFTAALVSHVIHLATDLLDTTSLVDSVETEEASSWSSSEEHGPSTDAIWDGRAASLSCLETRSVGSTWLQRDGEVRFKTSQGGSEMKE